MKLILVRHGEIVGNIKSVIQGHLPGKLSRKGRLQAKRVSKRLKGEKIDYVYCSDLKRALDTAKEIMKYHKHAPFKTTKELREVYHGRLEGKNRKVVGYISVKDAENTKQLIKRAKRILDKILHKHKKDTVLFVTHGVFGKALVSVIKNGKIKDRLPREWWLHNTSVSIFKIYEDKRHRIHLFNDISHLSKKEAQALKKKYAWK